MSARQWAGAQGIILARRGSGSAGSWFQPGGTPGGHAGHSLPRGVLMVRNT